MTLATQKTFVDVLVSIEMKLVKLGWVTISRSGERRTANVTEPRVLKWAIAVCIKSGISSEFINTVLEKTPPERHWHRIRAHLPESAFYVLEGKLDGFLLSDEH
ncbi:MAG: hypothetical protein KME11_03165 [Timaviella obliquedivisa GSE-PSE-MK23-08B]|jgi:hypothetical protein|nr:hypothetical protein [Timaviella obliquedivisa GSE-PSE-MK23-08B]MBW4514208.1 hypothetical protein [Timaviella obliquedivisa GSE-PSE-MK23-08B]